MSADMHDHAAVTSLAFAAVTAPSTSRSPMDSPDPRAGTRRPAARTVELLPGVPTRIPGTRVELRWDGDRPTTLHARAGKWDLHPLLSPGPAQLLAWQRLATRPHLGWWPLLPVLNPADY